MSIFLSPVLEFQEIMRFEACPLACLHVIACDNVLQNVFMEGVFERSSYTSLLVLNHLQ